MAAFFPHAQVPTSASPEERGCLLRLTVRAVQEQVSDSSTRCSPGQVGREVNQKTGGRDQSRGRGLFYFKTQRKGVPWWHSRLRTWPCHCCGSSYCCGANEIQSGAKKKKKKKQRDLGKAVILNETLRTKEELFLGVLLSALWSSLLHSLPAPQGNLQ